MISHLPVKINLLNDVYIIVNENDNICPCLKIYSILNFSLKNISNNYFFTSVVLLILYHLGNMLCNIQNNWTLQYSDVLSLT